MPGNQSLVTASNARPLERLLVIVGITMLLDLEGDQWTMAQLGVNPQEIVLQTTRDFFDVRME